MPSWQDTRSVPLEARAHPRIFVSAGRKSPLVLSLG